MTYQVLTDDTNKIIYHSNTRSAICLQIHKLRLNIFDGEISTNVIKSRHEKNKKDQYTIVIQSEEMIRKTFITKSLANEERHRACLVNTIKQHEDKTSKKKGWL